MDNSGLYIYKFHLERYYERISIKFVIGLRSKILLWSFIGVKLVFPILGQKIFVSDSFFKNGEYK